MIDINENSLYMLEQEFNRNRTHGILNKTIEIISLIASIREFKAINGIFKEYNPDVVFHAVHTTCSVNGNASYGSYQEQCIRNK